MVTLANAVGSSKSVCEHVTRSYFNCGDSKWYYRFIKSDGICGSCKIIFVTSASVGSLSRKDEPDSSVVIRLLIATVLAKLFMGALGSTAKTSSIWPKTSCAAHRAVPTPVPKSSTVFGWNSFPSRCRADRTDLRDKASRNIQLISSCWQSQPLSWLWHSRRAPCPTNMHGPPPRRR